jgi:hypothetical protein
MIRDRAWGRKKFGEAWEMFSDAVQNTNPHNPANGAYGHLLRCCQIAKGMGWGRDVVERGMLTLRPAVKWHSEWNERVRGRWLDNAWEKAQWHD